MPPKKLGPRDILAEYGLQLLKEADKITDPELKRIAIRATEKYFDTHTTGNAPVSPKLALWLIVPILALLAGITICSAVYLSRGIFISVLLTTVPFSVIFAIVLLGICGVIQESALVKALV